VPQYRLSATVKNTLEIKKSQFITWLLPIESKQQAKEFLQQSKDEYPDARHHCWAYLMGDSANSLTAAMSDDGEPSGTAGKPMLNVLQHKGVYNVMVIVIRYFGGVKLGAGGLVRAYSQAVEQSFALAEFKEIVPTFNILLDVDFSNEQWVRHHIELISGQITKVNYGNSAAVHAQIPQQEFDNFQQTMDSKQILCKIVP